MSNFTSKLHHTCDECESEFAISYSENNCDDDPIYCPFCSTYLIIGDIEHDDEEDE